MRPTRFLALLALLAAGLAPTPALARRSVTVRVPTFDVPPRSNREICTFVAVPAREAMQVREVAIRNLGGKASFGTHHLIVYAYSGDLAPLAGTQGQVVDDTACLNFGGGDPTKLRIFATAQAVRVREPMPHGTALRLDPRPMATASRRSASSSTALINGTDRTQRARGRSSCSRTEGTVERELKPIFEVVANGTLRSARRDGQVGYQWAPGNSVSASSSRSRRHAAARRPGLRHDAHRPHAPARHAFTADSSTRHEPPLHEHRAEPPAKRYDPPLLVRPGERITYSCTHDNATDRGWLVRRARRPRRIILQLFARPMFTSIDGSARFCSTPARVRASARSVRTRRGPTELHRQLRSCEPGLRLPLRRRCASSRYYHDAIRPPAGQECSL
jgi:hypothetical protein